MQREDIKSLLATIEKQNEMIMKLQAQILEMQQESKEKDTNTINIFNNDLL